MTTAELLRLAAAALENGEDPFGAAFLSEHDVTSGQCMTLAANLALGARVIAYAIVNPRSEEGTAMMMQLARTATGQWRP